jgi:hypothetical protein
MLMNKKLVEAFEDLNLLAMELAIKNGADINCSHPDGGTLLSVAVDSAIDSNIQSGGQPGDEELRYVALLLEKGADINLKILGQSSALERAEAYKSARNVVDFLQEFNS